MLKALIEDGHVALFDGRLLTKRADGLTVLKDDPSLVLIHPDFRMIVLANRFELRSTTVLIVLTMLY